MSTGNKTLRGGRESDDEADMIMMITVMMPLVPSLFWWSRVVDGGGGGVFLAPIGTNADSMLDVFFKDFCFPKLFV